MAVIRCTGCGKDIPDQASVCPSCGYSLHINRYRMTGAPPFSDISPLSPEESAGREVEPFSLRTVIARAGIIVVAVGVLVGAFLYCVRMPAANAFMQRVADSYGSVGIIQTLVNVPGLIAGNVPSIEANPVNNNRSVAAPTRRAPGVATPVGSGIGGTQTRNVPPVVVKKNVAPNTSYFVPNPKETCSQQASDWVSEENNGNPNGTSGGSSVNGTVVFQGVVKTALYKTFSGPGKPCLFATYTTWTQSTGEIWEQQLFIGDITNPDPSIWMQGVQPAESEDAAFHDLDVAISSVEQNGSGPQELQPQTPSLPPGNIAEQSIVPLLCHYSDGSEARGSGVIVDPQGYILTAKHVVDPKWTSWAYEKAPTNATLDYCEVGVPPPNTLATAQEIESVNPIINVPTPFPFVATLSFEPSQGQLSDNEYRQLDFAVLKITSPMNNCAAFNACYLPTRYPYSPVYYADVPGTASFNQILNFGYPYETASTSTDNFTLYYLKGTVGRLTQYYVGDQYFDKQPFNFSWSGIDVLPGRSGSPVFWNGYVVGIEYGGDVDNVTNDVAIGLPAIDQILKANGLENILSTN